MAHCEFESYPFRAGPAQTTNNEYRTTSVPDDEEENDMRAREN